MIVYSSTKDTYLRDSLDNVLVDKLVSSLKAKGISGTGHAHIESYCNSLRYMDTVVSDAEIPGDCGVAIEYVLPSTSKRVDFIISGKDETGAASVVMVELKQWEKAERTEKDAIVRTWVGGAERECEHPSYQAWSYAALLRNFNEAVERDSIDLRPCAYLHNYEPDGVIDHLFYKEHLDGAPLFLKHDASKLQSFIKSFIRKGDDGSTLYLIENGKIRPSKALADALGGMLEGNREFILIDDQKRVYETALELAQRKPKQVLIVSGGPGTGKSVVAINLLVEATKRELTAHYVSKNSAPRTVYQAKLVGHPKKTLINCLFKSSGSYIDCEPDCIDMLIVDEAHRLNDKSGIYRHLGENQVKEIIEAAKTSVFFLDEDQRVTWNDIGSRQEIARWSKKAKAKITEMELSSQFRCGGSDGYLAWLDSTLQKRETANTILNTSAYDFRVFDSPSELRSAIRSLDASRNKARMVAGYCWKWSSKKDPRAYDIEFPEFKFKARWNLAEQGSEWIIRPDSVEEIGCIHTCQGLELDYVGVIIGPDLLVRDGEIVTDALARASQDKTIHGFRRLSRTDPDKAWKKADEIIRNTYRTLMTRGMLGCFIFSEDKETRDYFASRIVNGKFVDSNPKPESRWMPEILPFVEPGKQFTEYLPLYSLNAACGYFGDGVEPMIDGWIRPSADMKLNHQLFVARASGHSMEPSIHDGDYCVFRSNPGGSRNGKILLVQLRRYVDPDTGGRYTIKKYESRKKTGGPDDGWIHESINLTPLNPAFQPIVLDGDDDSTYSVIAEFIGVISDTRRR